MMWGSSKQPVALPPSQPAPGDRGTRPGSPPSFEYSSLVLSPSTRPKPRPSGQRPIRAPAHQPRSSGAGSRPRHPPTSRPSRPAGSAGRPGPGTSATGSRRAILTTGRPSVASPPNARRPPSGAASHRAVRNPSHRFARRARHRRSAQCCRSGRGPPEPAVSPPRRDPRRGTRRQGAGSPAHQDAHQARGRVAVIRPCRRATPPAQQREENR